MRIGRSVLRTIEKPREHRRARGRHHTALIIDGPYVGDYVILVALGIDEGGDKHVLGMYEGATENSTACKGLLSDLERRGMRTDRSVLVVLDGSKALLSAVRAVFGARAVVQRCQVHKRRNVEDHRPENIRRSIGSAMSKAYHSRDVAKAEKILNGLANQLERSAPPSSRIVARGARRNAHRAAHGAARLARTNVGDDERHREPERLAPSHHQASEALGRRHDGAALGRGLAHRSQQGLPKTPRLQGHAEAARGFAHARRRSRNHD